MCELTQLCMCVLYFSSAMDKARGILKSCENFLVQTTAAMPAIMEEEEEGDRAGGSEDKMDTGEQQAKVPGTYTL